MKVDALSSFTSKLVQLNDVDFMKQLSAFVQKVENSDDITPFLADCARSGDVYIMALGDYSLYFSIIENVWYFIDLINPTKFRAGIGVRDPRYNHSINPTFNHSINPVFNHMINPTFNHSINPTFNHSINPTFNHSINPTFNHSINPVFNHMINPTFKKNIDGFYIYGLNNEKVYYSVNALSRQDIMLIYKLENNQLAYYAVQRNTGFCIFDASKNSYVGFLESNNKEGYNWFDTNGKWCYFLV